jgi:uncharacterized peroxidase-related enzyme
MSITGLVMIEEDEADSEIQALYEETKRALDSPYVPNLMKTLAVAPSILTMCIDTFRTFYQNTTLPQSLIAMLSYIIPVVKECRYCAANGELYCRTIGIDEETLEALARDLGKVSPQRVRVILQFGIKCATQPQALTAADYEEVRAQGVTDQEIVEIIMVAAMANYGDTLADALKLELDPVVAEALGR